MKRSLSTLVIAAILMLTLASPGYGVEPQVTADAAIVLDVQTGQILYEKNIYQKRPPASTTKIITALIAIENGNLNDMVAVSPKAAQTEESSMELKANEKLTLSDLLYGALLWSSNDACVAIAEHIAGSEEKFVQMMNQKARAMGALNTHFTNTNGLPDENHFSCVNDLAVMSQKALKNSVLAQIVQTRFKLVTSDKNQWPLDNTNRLLWSYVGADGVKTGTTNAAGLCLVSSATRKGRQVISVVLHSDDRYTDAIKLLDYGFNEFYLERCLIKGNTYGSIRVINGQLAKVAVTASENVDVVLPRQDNGAVEKKVLLKTALPAPIRKGQLLGKYEIYIHGQKIIAKDLVALSAIKEATLGQKIERFWEKIF